METQIRGVAAVLVNGRGQIMSAVVDVDAVTYGGFKLREAQRIRARNKLCAKFITDYCIPDLAAALSGREEQLVADLQRRCDWKIHFEEIGWEDDQPAA